MKWAPRAISAFIFLGSLAVACRSGPAPIPDHAKPTREDGYEEIFDGRIVSISPWNVGLYGSNVGDGEFPTSLRKRLEEEGLTFTDYAPYASASSDNYCLLYRYGDLVQGGPVTEIFMQHEGTEDKAEQYSFFIQVEIVSDPCNE
jgi:hypothetical protein